MPDVTESDLDTLQADIDSRLNGTGKSIIGTRIGNLTGKLPRGGVNRSACAQLKWLDDNTPFNWTGVVEVEANGGRQGLVARRKTDNTVARRLWMNITGGDDADVYKQIPINHRRLVKFVMVRVARRLQLAGAE